MDCENLSFSEKLSSQRIVKAEIALGKTIVQKIISFSLYLLGVDRATIALQLSIPPGTIRSLVRSFNNKGLAALFDKRTKTLLPKVEPIPESSEPRIEEDTDYVKIIFGVGEQIINIPISNQSQKKIVLLTLLNSKILKRADVAKTLGLSEDRTIKLARKLTQNDATDIADQRQGQQMDFLYTPQIKAEIIQQFVIDIITKGRISGKQLSKNLEERCQIELSSRSILHHISKLGLRDIRSSLPNLLEDAKKKSSRS
ncbi:MAG: hypothetical protein HN580_14395 [Deltaproteobacteria bacterium]|jgi:hypothetical protein|uniref:hypothetical protein n=1 Tax=Desulfobacula sp. TaxID=2593537 RepID=UPI001D23AE36|nr:hypothetical protein [Desulfobacula sp.]MBT5539946.1 hypothetical protein [Candidatus Neomarinimicrobiota bacterium]MBT6753752.1 hypothetical protein [bacterium]MBT7890208.1 hypothetical protein [Deltaproteobacteria bacterium]